MRVGEVVENDMRGISASVEWGSRGKVCSLRK